jgi:predicted permease
MAVWTRIANVFRSRRLTRDLDEELAFHVAEHMDDLVADGMPEDEARTEAERRFGNYTFQKERTRDMNIAGWLEALMKDLRHGARQLRLNPGFTAVAVLSLALGIGANSAIFQLINSLRLRSLPVHEPSQLASIDEAKSPEFMTAGWYSSRHRAFTYAQWDMMQKHQQAFSQLFAFNPTRFNLSKGGEARLAEGMYVSSGFLDVLGVTPTLGRGFSAENDRPDCAAAGVLLNYGFWQREFQGDPNAIGRTMYVQGLTLPILGVTPPEFFGIEPGRRFDIAVPLCVDALTSENGKGRMPLRDAWWLTPVGRLKPGWTVEKASAHMRDLSPAIFRETVPEKYRPDTVKRYLANKLAVTPAGSGLSSLRRQYENPLWILLAVSALVLVIACANLANLLLARATAREREIGVRQALGASRVRLIGQLLAESFLLAALGATLGAMLAQGLSRSLVAFLNGGENTIQMSLGVDWNVFAFTTILALVTCILFGLAPAVRATGTGPASAMHGGRGNTATRERNGLRRTLVVSQIAVSLVLLVAALLFGRSLHNLTTTETGIVPEGVLIAGVDASMPKLDPAHRRIVWAQLQERLNNLPGVVSAASVRMSPFSGSGWNQEGYVPGSKDAKKEVWLNRVGPGYFKTLLAPVLAGREFNERDNISAPKVAIVNEQFAKKFFGNTNPVGKSFRIEEEAGKADSEFEIVGLVKYTRYNGMREDDRSIAFVSYGQEDKPDEGVTFLLRSKAPLSSVMAGVRNTMASLHPGLMVEFRVLDVQVSRSILRERLMASLSGGFGLLAAILSTLGLYGVMSYMVTRRKNEIGVRMALGAQPGDVLGLVFREAGQLLAVGLVLGLAGSWALSRYAESLLYGLKPNDATTLVLACSLLALTAIGAALLPARRAARMDPAMVLREE